MAKGKKTCKSCGKEVALRTAKCDCGAEFTIKKKEETPEPTVIVNRGELMIVCTPGTGAGEKGKVDLIPVMPEGFEISKWIEACQVKGEKRGVTYAKSAFNYMARQIWREKDDLEKALALIADDFRRELHERPDEVGV